MGPRSSRRLPGALVALAAAVLAFGAGGCGGSRGSAARPVPADPGIARGGPPAAGTPRSGSPGPAKGGDAARRLDPSEEITPEELASIPEPLPASSTTLKGALDQPMDSVAPAPSETPSGAAQTPAGTAGDPVTLGAAVWRVQIFASDRREEADRVSREAAQALSVAASVDRDGALYKVRLGRFATEAEAQALRERAIRAGFPGAFRIKTTR